MAQIQACLTCKKCKSNNKNYCSHTVGMLGHVGDIWICDIGADRRDESTDRRYRDDFILYNKQSEQAII